MREPCLVIEGAMFRFWFGVAWCAEVVCQLVLGHLTLGKDVKCRFFPPHWEVLAVKGKAFIIGCVDFATIPAPRVSNESRPNNSIENIFLGIQLNSLSCCIICYYSLFTGPKCYSSLVTQPFFWWMNSSQKYLNSLIESRTKITGKGGPFIFSHELHSFFRGHPKFPFSPSYTNYCVKSACTNSHIFLAPSNNCLAFAAL